MSDIVQHEDLIKLNQYHMSLYRELERFEKENPKFKRGSGILMLSRKIVEVSTTIADKRIIGGASVSNPISKDSIFWALIVLCFLLFSIGVSMGIGYIAIADLENCAYKGMCVEIPKGK